MTSHVTLRPSGHSFDVEGRDSILQAGLKAGLALPYGCSNGSCGSCLARLVTGSIEKCGHHDFIVPEAQKAEGYFLMCAHEAVSTTLEIETWEASGSVEIPEQEISLRIKTVEYPVPDIAVVRARTPRSQRLRFLAGQSVALSVPGGGSKSVPLASCPCDDMNLEFHLPRLSDCQVTQTFFSDRPPATVDIVGPTGDFVLGEPAGRILLFVAEGTGFAPVRSLIEHAQSIDDERSMVLYWFANGVGHYMANLCRSWAEAFDGFQYVPVEADDRHQALARMLEKVPNPASADVYAAAGEPLLEAVSLVFGESGVEPGRIRLCRIN